MLGVWDTKEHYMMSSKEMITELGSDMMIKVHRECSGRTKRNTEFD